MVLAVVQTNKYGWSSWCDYMQ